MTVRTIAYVADAAAGLVVVGTLTAWLPPIAAGLTIVYISMRIAQLAWRMMGRPGR